MSEELDALLLLIDTTPKGNKRIPIIEEAIRLADNEKILELQLNLRYMLTLNSILYEDCLKAVVIFPRYISLIDENSETVNEDDIYSSLWAFKYILFNGNGFYQISWDKLNFLAEEFKNRCIQYGFSLRYYYELITQYNMYFNKIDEAEKSFKKYKECKRDKLSDCEACELDFNMEYFLFLNNLEEAYKEIKPVLEGEKCCIEVPNITYAKLLHYFVKNNKLNEASEIIDKSYKLISKNEKFLQYIDGHIAYYAIKDIDKGITLFARHLDWALKSRNEAHKLKFYTASWFLWEKVKILNYNDEYLLRLPKNTPFYVENGKYKTEEILKYCKNQAMNIAVNFNKRDGENTADKYIDEIRMCVLKDV